MVLFCFRVCWIHHVTGVWVYPLLEHLSPGVKIIFFAAVTVIINIFYVMGEVLNNYIWDTQKCEYCFRNINSWNNLSGLECAALKVKKIFSRLKWKRMTEVPLKLLACLLLRAVKWMEWLLESTMCYEYVFFFITSNINLRAASNYLKPTWFTTHLLADESIKCL